MLRRILINAILLLGLSVTAAAQETIIEYGRASELRGVSKLYVFTDTDMQARAELVKELRQRLPRLEITETPEAADAHLVYRHETLRVPGAVTWISETAPMTLAAVRDDYNGVRTTVVASQLTQVEVGTGVIFRLVGPGRVRLLMSFKGESLAGSFERNPSANFVRAFVKEYKSANPPQARVSEFIRPHRQ